MSSIATTTSTTTNNTTTTTLMEPTVYQTRPSFSYLLPMPLPPPPRSNTSSTTSSGGVGGRVVKQQRKERRMKTTKKKVRSSKSNIPGESRYWTPSEHKLFVEALLRFGPKNLKDIAAYVGTRNMIQCRTHEQKCFMRLLREAQKETAKRAGDANMKVAKDCYSVPPNCGISLLCVVSEEMTRALQ